MNVDLAVRSRSLEIFLAVFVPNTPKMFNIDNPKLTLSLSIQKPKERETQVNNYLGGVDPQGFAAIVDVGRMYSIGVNINKIKLFGFDAISHMLSRQLEISAEETEELITKKWKQGFTRIVFIKKSNYSGCRDMANNSWLIKKVVPDEDTRNIRLNKKLAKSSKFRVVTSKTYAMRVYNGD